VAESRRLKAVVEPPHSKGLSPLRRARGHARAEGRVRDRPLLRAAGEAVVNGAGARGAE
jgi:hypothetical protein